MAIAEIISMQTIPAPILEQIRRKGRSVKPAIGANIYSFFKVTFPMFIGLFCNYFNDRFAAGKFVVLAPGRNIDTKFARTLCDGYLMS